MALTFDAENRITSYGGSTLTNGYRGDSLRAWKQNSAGRTYFLYSGSQLVCELSSSGTVTATNTVGPAGLISRHTSSGSVFYAFDTHGSVCQRLSSTGSVLSTQTFDAYGSRLSTDGNSDPYAGYGGQSGYYSDWETGTASSALELLTFRYYDPSAGRFLTRDPAGHQGGANLYEYCDNEPANSTDPSGRAFNSDPIGALTGACLGAVLGNEEGTINDSCNSADYNHCLELQDCLADVGSAAIGGIITGIADAATDGALTLLSKFIYGCIEGLASVLWHNEAEEYCRSQYHTCSPEANSTCKFLSNALDVAFGCFDGALGRFMSKYEIEGFEKQLDEFAYETITANFSNKYESSDCQGAGRG